MHRLAIVAAVLAMLGAVPGQAASSFEVKGEITVPNPASKVWRGVTEAANPCGRPDPDLKENGLGGDVNGLDGRWITLPKDVGWRDARLTYPATPDAPGPSTSVDMDVWFYSADCELIDIDKDDFAFSMATMPVARDEAGDPVLVLKEEGTIPKGAAYAIVNHVAGGPNTPFTFTIL